jgi:hypothetical protein
MKNFNLKRWALAFIISLVSANTLHSIPPLTGVSTSLKKLCGNAMLEAEDTQDEINNDLLWAAQDGDIKNMKLALDRNADINFQNDWSQTALIKAAHRGHEEAVQLLIKAGAHLDLGKPWLGGSALIHAARRGHIKVAKLLLDAGANLHLEGCYLSDINLDGGPAIAHAIERTNPEMATLLLQYNAVLPARMLKHMSYFFPWWNDPQYENFEDTLLEENEIETTILTRRLIKNVYLLAHATTREELNALLPEYVALQPAIAASSQEVQAAFAHFFLAAHKRVMKLTGRAIRVCQDHAHAPEIAPASSLPEAAHSKRKRNDETQKAKRVRHDGEDEGEDSDDEEFSLPQAPQTSSHGTQSSSGPITMHIVENETENGEA